VAARRAARPRRAPPPRLAIRRRHVGFSGLFAAAGTECDALRGRHGQHPRPLSLATSIDVLAGAGIERIAAHVVALSDRLVDGLSTRGWTVLANRSRDEVKSGIVTFRRDDVDSIALGRRLARCRHLCHLPANGIRIAPHGHNTVDDIDAILDALE